MHGKVQLANSLNWLDCRGELLVQCINPYAEPVKLSAGLLVGRYHSVKETDVWPTLDAASETLSYPLKSGTGPVPEHVAELYKETCGGCGSNVERRQMAQLLREYQDVVSCGYDDMRLTNVVRHEIPLVAGTAPMRQLTQRLGPVKEREVSRQVHDLLDRDLI